ncbi:hypothetical protein EB796_013910 [Bugula neritina]|uniref:Uncharacterized protein n=1 Tax=Bugula neritina TaxID=10212 RepID=A0A7J7JN52_BUGNE|nr:hypothetical protein EB796_013910 [Bugula neritina]
MLYYWEIENMKFPRWLGCTIKLLLMVFYNLLRSAIHICIMFFLLIAVTPFSSNTSAWDLVVLGSDFRLGSFGLLPSSLSRCC